MYTPPDGQGVSGGNRTGRSFPTGVKATVDSVTSNSMPAVASNPSLNSVPRMPAVPTGLEISKFDFLLSYLVCTTREPTSKSTKTLEGLSSS